MRLIVLTSLLIISILTTSISEETTTSNLLSQDFSTGWSGTATGRHGNSVVAAVDDTYIKSDSVSLKDDANLTEAQLQDGFTSSHSFKYWHWNDYDSTVSSKVTITGQMVKQQHKLGHIVLRVVVALTVVVTNLALTLFLYLEILKLIMI